MFVTLAGANSVTPHIGANGNWYIGAADTGVKAQGANGAAGKSERLVRLTVTFKAEGSPRKDRQYRRMGQDSF